MADSSTIDVINPATGESIERVGVSSRKEVDAAVERSREGFEEWSGYAGLDRAEVFHEMAARMRSHADELAEIMTLEGGKPFIENRDEVTWSAACFDYYAEIARDSVGYLPAPIEPQQLAMVVREPVGTAACIVPWNYPLLLAAWKVAPALAAGNAVVLKPSEETPLATRRLAELMEELPAGLLQVVYGAGEVGEMLVRHPGVDMVAFTGSQETGRKVGVAAAERLIRANLELGGKDPFIVCDDVDVEIAARGAVWAACLNAGQVCTSSERFYVEKGIAEDFVEASREFVGSLNVGDPMDGSTDIGPMVNEKSRAKVERHVGEALAGGATLGSGPEDLEKTFITHQHDDHASGLEGIPEWAPHAGVGVSEHEAAVVVSGARPLDPPSTPPIRYMARNAEPPGVPVGKELREGDLVSGFRIIPTPGHTPGRVSLLRDADGLLLTADAFGCPPRKLRVGVRKSLCNDPPRARRSAERLLADDFSTVVPVHGPILRENPRDRPREVVARCRN